MAAQRGWREREMEREPGEKVKTGRSQRRPHHYKVKLSPALLTFIAVDCLIYYQHRYATFKLYWLWSPWKERRQKEKEHADSVRILKTGTMLTLLRLRLLNSLIQQDDLFAMKYSEVKWPGLGPAEWQQPFETEDRTSPLCCTHVCLWVTDTPCDLAWWLWPLGTPRQWAGSGMWQTKKT